MSPLRSLWIGSSPRFGHSQSERVKPFAVNVRREGQQKQTEFGECFDSAFNFGCPLGAFSAKTLPTGWRMVCLR